MAISFVGASPVVTGANPTVDIPSGVQAGDFLMLFVSSNSTSSTPTNWTVQYNSNSGSQLFTKTASDSESSFVMGNINAVTTAVLLAYRGVGYIDVLNGSPASGNSTSPATTSVTTRFTNDYVVSFYSNNNIARTWTAPASTTERLNYSSTSSFRGVLIVDELQASAGASTTRTATLSSATTWTALAIALKEPQVFYIDPENGNDANAGTSFGTSLKNISGATSAKGITAGDTVRLKEAPIYNTGVNATWTSVQSRGVSPFNNIQVGSATNATPIVCTSAVAHGYSTGDVVQISGVSGNTAANGVWKITVTGSTTFSLDDSSGNGSYLSGGSISPIFCRTIKTASALVKPIASFAPLNTVSLGTRASWVGATANVTTSIGTAFPKGAVNDIITINSSFTTGKIAYYTLPATLDLSAYQQLSLFINQSGGSTLGGLTISLCSDTTGDTAVDTFTIPSIGATAVWCPFTLNKGSALGSSIRSISISRAANNGAQTFSFNSIVAVKSPTSVDALSNTSLVTKNNGTEGAYSVGGFGGSDGTIVFLDSGPTAANTTTGAGAYYGTSETVTLHRIEPFNPFTLNSVALPASSNASNTYCTYPNNAGQLNNHITYSGGWNATDMSTRTGETWFTNLNGNGQGVTHSTGTSGYLTIDRCNYTRCFSGVYLNASITTRVIYQNCNYTATVSNGIDNNTPVYPLEIKNCIVTNTSGVGLRLFAGSNSVANPSIIDNCTFSGNSTNNIIGFGSTATPFLNITNSSLNTTSGTGVSFTNNPMFGNITNCSFNYFNTIGLSTAVPIIGTIDTVTFTPEPNGGSEIIRVDNSGPFNQLPQNIYTTFRNVTVNAPTTAFSQGLTQVTYIIQGGSNCKFYNCSFGATNVNYGGGNIRIFDSGSTYLYSCTGFSGTPAAAISNYSPHLLNNAAYSQDEGGNIGNNKIYFVGGLATSQTAVRRTPSGYAWSIAPTSTSTVTASFPIKLKIASIAANGSAPVTVSTWMRRTNTGLTMQLVCPAGQPYGPTSDVVSSITAVADTWQEVSITFTPTQNAVFDIYVYAYGGTTFTGYVDDLTVSQ